MQRRRSLRIPSPKNDDAVIVGSLVIAGREVIQSRRQISRVLPDRLFRMSNMPVLRRRFELAGEGEAHTYARRKPRMKERLR